MKSAKSQLKEHIEWRRSKVQELAVKGFSQIEISQMLQISEPTISRDVSHLKQVANMTIKNHIESTLPYQYSKCLQGIEEIIKESWRIAEQTKDERSKLQSLSLIGETYSKKMDLLTNASLLKDSIKWVESQKDKLLTNQSNNINSNNNHDLQGSKESDTTRRISTGTKSQT